MEILFVSDYVCPYCLVAKEALSQALAETGMEADIVWQPFELTQEPKPRVDTWNDQTRRARYGVLVEPCKQLGIDMKLPPNVVPRPYTRLAFEGWHYACAKGCGEAYNDLIYRAYFVDEKDIGEICVLKELAVQVGLNGDDFAEALEKGTYREMQKKSADYSRNVLGIKSVPSIYVNGEKINLSTYTKEEMIGILQEEAQRDAAPGFACGEDGCEMF